MHHQQLAEEFISLKYPFTALNKRNQTETVWLFCEVICKAQKHGQRKLKFGFSF